MKRFVLSLCWLFVVTLALSPAMLAAPTTSPSAVPPLGAGACGKTAATTVADIPSFLAGVRLATTCTSTCTDEHTACRQECRDPSCSVGYFSCDPVNPCAAVCECFCL